MNLIANLISVSKTANQKIEALSNCSFYRGRLDMIAYWVLELKLLLLRKKFRCPNVNFISFEIHVCWYVVVHKYQLLTEVFPNKFDDLIHDSCFQGYNISYILL